MIRSAPRALLLGALIASAYGVATADDYPSRIIKLVVAAPPGGGIDIVGRLIEPTMSQNLGQKIIVEKVEIDPKLDEADFARPPAPPAAPPADQKP